MNRTKKLKSILLAAVFANCVCIVNGQTSMPDTTFNREVIQISQLYKESIHVQFKIGTTVYEEDSSGNTTANSTWDVHIGRNKFYMKADSTEYMQNDFYNVMAMKDDSLIRIQKPVPIDDKLFSANLFDKTLRNSYISGFTYSDSANFRKINVLFASNAPYMEYSISYDTSYYAIKKIVYTIKKGNFLTPALISQWSVGTAGFIKVTQVFSDYVFSEEGDSVFATSRFFVIQNGVIVPVAPYANFDVINSALE